MCFGLLFGFNIESIKADFVQNIKNSDGGDNINYSGTLVAKSNGMAYWKYEIPLKKEIFIQKDRITIYEPMLNQAIVSDKVSLDFVTILNSIKQNGNNLRSEVNGTTFDITLKDNKPYQITYTDELDNHITITLTNVAIDTKIDENIFKPSLPEDTEIIFE